MIIILYLNNHTIRNKLLSSFTSVHFTFTIMQDYDYSQADDTDTHTIANRIPDDGYHSNYTLTTQENSGLSSKSQRCKEKRTSSLGSVAVDNFDGKKKRKKRGNKCPVPLVTPLTSHDNAACYRSRGNVTVYVYS